MAIAVLVLYLLAVIAIGFYMRRRVHNEKDYLAAGGRLVRWWAGPPWPPRR
jgi:Na+/proline symporter